MAATGAGIQFWKKAWRLGGEEFVDAKNAFVRKEEDGSLSFDQLGWAINELKVNPDSRRIVINAWHPAMQRSANCRHVTRVGF